MTKDEIIQECIDNNTEADILDQVGEAMYDFVDEDDIEEYGDLYDAYGEVGRGEAETQVLQDVLRKYKDQECLKDLDTYCEVWDTLCDTWNISTD